MAEKQRGRPKRIENAKTNETGQVEAKEETKLEEKIVEKTTPKPTLQKIREEKKKTFTIFVRGKAREVSRPTYEALKKDRKMKVTLPKNSRLVEPTPKPCKDC